MDSQYTIGYQIPFSSILLTPSLRPPPEENPPSKASSEKTQIQASSSIASTLPSFFLDIVLSIPYHIQTLYLFIHSDIKTTIVPCTLFGLSNASAFSPSPSSSFSLSLLSLSSLSNLLIWTTLHLLAFTVSNQRHARAISEDLVNKPWRPLPSRRLTPRSAALLSPLLHALALLYSCLYSNSRTGAALLRSSVALLLLGTWYNDLGGGDGNPVVRNGINSLGYVAFLSGALEAVLLGNHVFSGSGGGGGGGGGGEQGGERMMMMSWLGILAGVVFTTGHAQDMKDQEGDAARGRRTVPLVFGDGVARWIISVGVLFWGVVCLLFWRVDGLAARAMVLSLSGLVSMRFLIWRNVGSDKVSFIWWNVWISIIYVVPLLAGVQGEDG